MTRGRLTAALLAASVLAGCGGDDRVKVPDVRGIDALDARRVVLGVGLRVELDPEPRFPTRCRVQEQSELGRVPKDTAIVLRLSCPNQ